MLVVENLQLKLNGNSIINGLDLHVGKGEIHGILGENGTGKTTIANLIMGTNNYRPTGGRIIFEGEDISKLSVSERAKRGITLAWQEPARVEGLTVRDYLRLSSKNGQGDQRIEMASVLAMHPKLAILDEPDSGIDIVALPLLLNGIMEMNRQGSSVLLITHSERVTEVAHRVSILCAGKIISTGAPLETSQWFKNNCLTCPHINEPAH
jgi:Fe-S cluster assembly ATP-binding protein